MSVATRLALLEFYNRARYTGEMREALQRWADHLQGICER